MFCRKTRIFIPELVSAFLMGEKNSNFYPGDACCMELFGFDKKLLFFFSLLKLFTDETYSPYSDLTNWKVWLY